jgi:hypothetical protein
VRSGWLVRATAPLGAYKLPRATSCRICFSSDSSATRRGLADRDPELEEVTMCTVS